MIIKPRTVRDAASENRTQFIWGTIGVIVTVIALAIAAVVYFVPFGQQSYTADFRSTGGARSGDEVRVAGIKVGKVESVKLAGDHVEIKFGVKNDVPVGDMSTVEIKMLTPIGGHYISLAPAGDTALGDRHIPPEHTETPYELGDLLEKATPVLQNIDGTTLRETIAEVNKAIQGQPEAVRSILGNVNDLTGVIAKRSDQLEKALAVSDEYVGAIANDQVVLADFVTQLGILAVKLGQKKGEVIATFNMLSRVFRVLHRPLMAYGDSIEPSVTQAEELFNKVLADQGNIDTVINGIKDFIVKISTMLGVEGLTIDQSASVVTDTSICIPSPGKAC